MTMSKKLVAILTEAARTASATALAMWVAMGVDIWSLDADALKALSAAAVAAGVQVVLRYLQPGGEFGIGADKK
jgi:hypothetical protein